MMENGYSRLHRVLSEHTKKQTAAPPVMDLGTIQSDGSLKLDHFDHALPSGDYLKFRGAVFDIGDRVLVAWVGNDPFVLGVM